MAHKKSFKSIKRSIRYFIEKKKSKDGLKKKPTTKQREKVIKLAEAWTEETHGREFIWTENLPN